MLSYILELNDHPCSLAVLLPPSSSSLGWCLLPRVRGFCGPLGPRVAFGFSISIAGCALVCRDGRARVSRQVWWVPFLYEACFGVSLPRMSVPSGRLRSSVTPLLNVLAWDERLQRNMPKTIYGELFTRCRWWQM